MCVCSSCSYIVEAEFPLHDLLGIANGHLYTLARSRGLLRPPAPLVHWFESKPKLMRRYQAMGDEEPVE